jgi:3',5'-cyclic AMP phosphodiesterase CpdA
MLEDLGSIHEVDLILCGHIHSLITEEQIMRKPNFVTGNVDNKKQVLVATGAFLEYGDYAEKARYKPEKMGAPKIKLYSTKKDMHTGK